MRPGVHARRERQKWRQWMKSSGRSSTDGPWWILKCGTRDVLRRGGTGRGRLQEWTIIEPWPAFSAAPVMHPHPRPPSLPCRRGMKSYRRPSSRPPQTSVHPCPCPRLHLRPRPRPRLRQSHRGTNCGSNLRLHPPPPMLQRFRTALTRMTQMTCSCRVLHAVLMVAVFQPRLTSHQTL